jgi:hypothetical protein
MPRVHPMRSAMTLGGHVLAALQPHLPRNENAESLPQSSTASKVLPEVSTAVQPQGSVVSKPFS